jgi:hypothetical protein
LLLAVLLFGSFLSGRAALGPWLVMQFDLVSASLNPSENRMVSTAKQDISPGTLITDANLVWKPRSDSEDYRAPYGYTRSNLYYQDTESGSNNGVKEDLIGHKTVAVVRAGSPITKADMGQDPLATQLADAARYYPYLLAGWTIFLLLIIFKLVTNSMPPPQTSTVEEPVLESSEPEQD